MTCGPVQEAAGGFKDELSLGAAVDDPLMPGFDMSDISVLVGRRRVGRSFGTVTNHAAERAYEPEAPSTSYVGNDARIQTKTAIVASLECLGVLGFVYAVFLSGGTGTAAAVGAGAADSTWR